MGGEPSWPEALTETTGQEPAGTRAAAAPTEGAGKPVPGKAAGFPELKGPSGPAVLPKQGGTEQWTAPPGKSQTPSSPSLCQSRAAPAAYLGGPLSELSQHLGSVVRDDAQGVVQQGHVLQTREAADAPDLLHLQETSSLPSSLDCFGNRPTRQMASFQQDSFTVLL